VKADTSAKDHQGDSNRIRRIKKRKKKKKTIEENSKDVRKCV